LLRNRAYVRHFANILALKAFFGLYGLARVYNKKSGTQAFHSFCFYLRVQGHKGQKKALRAKMLAKSRA
jgi:hypothetical protein